MNSSNHSLNEKRDPELEKTKGAGYPNETKPEVYDSEVTTDDNAPFKGEEGRRGLSRQMKNRHVAMISIGGVIGTGLFLVSFLCI